MEDGLPQDPVAQDEGALEIVGCEVTENAEAEETYGR
jgi:hypothetical protein